ncbi:MAG: cyanoexosortase A [Oscillatoria princeps RMCB-10]|jgi:cyanoexosortase A|nr:cyanoexosortase A [Oscillatoria princeps RMCB-10]
MTQMDWLKSVPKQKLFVLGIAASLIAVQLYLADRFKMTELFGTSALAWGAVSFLLWEKRDTLNLKSGIFSKFFGGTLIALVLLKSLSLSAYHPFLRVSPLISAVSLGLAVSGVKGLKQYWQELLILCFPALSPAPAILVKTIDLTTLTAKFSGMLLWYLGFAVSRQGVYLSVANKSVEVGTGCSGLSVIMQMVMLAILFLFMFPTNWKQKILVPGVAVLVGFAVNVVRVALMAYLIAYSTEGAFEYWHFGQGSIIFSMIAAAIFGLFCQFGILRNEPENQ